MKPFLALITFSSFTAAVAQEAGVELQLETQSLEIGEAVDAQLICTNTGQPEVPQFSVPDGLDLQITNPVPAQFSQVSILNGRRTQKTTYTFSMRLVARKEGTFTIGPTVVVAEGASHQTAPVKVTVRKSETGVQPDNDKLVFVSIEVKPKSLYVTESLDATLVIGIRKVELNGQIVEMGNLLQTVDARASELSIFGSRFSSEGKWLTDSGGQRHEYVIYRSRIEPRAEKVGPMRVGPVFLKVSYPTAVRRGIFGGYEVSRSRKETARADAITVDVKGPPEEGRPEDFTGAIGRFKMTVGVKPTRVEQGRPVTLAISIEGTPVEGVAGPDLTKQAELLSRFDCTTDELTGDLEGDRTKVFRRAIFPRQQGEQTIPPISWSYFDPRSERYVTLTSDPIALIVDPPAAGASVAMWIDEAPQNNHRGELTVLRGGISPNYVDPELVLAQQAFTLPVTWTVGSLVVPPMMYLVVTLTVTHRARLRTDVGFARRRRAKRNANAILSQALNFGEPARQFHGLAEAMTRYLSDRFNLPPGELTPDDARTLLTARGEDGLADPIAGFLAACDAVRYAPGVMGTLSAAQAAEKVREWIDGLESGRR